MTGWTEIPNTKLLPTLPTIAEIGAAWCAETDGCPGGHFAWTGFAYNTDTHTIEIIRCGGHADGGAADSYRGVVELNSTGWTRSEPVQHLTGQVDSFGRCPWPAHGGPSQHTYGGLLYLGGGRYLHMGTPGFCKGATMTPGRFAFFVDTNVSPWSWVEQPQLATYAGPCATALSGQNVYVISNGKFAIFNKDTGVISKSGNIGAAKVNGVVQVGFSQFNAQQSSGAINSNGIFCTLNEVAIGLSDINGTNPNAQNDTRFGKMIRHPFGGGFTKGKCAVVALPGGSFALWHGGKDVWIFTPDFLNPANDQWVHHAPATGPTAQNAHTYTKLFWADHLGKLVGYSNRDENIWLFEL